MTRETPISFLPPKADEAPSDRQREAESVELDIAMCDPEMCHEARKMDVAPRDLDEGFADIAKGLDEELGRWG